MVFPKLSKTDIAMKNAMKLFSVIFLMLSLVHVALAQDDDGKWVVIAEKTVSFKAETDKITPRGNEQKVDRIKVKCLEGTLSLKSVRVEMSDGESEEYDPKGVGLLTKGMSSFSFKLPGKDNKLKSIEIDYDSKGNLIIGSRAKVEVLGRVIED